MNKLHAMMVAVAIGSAGLAYAQTSINLSGTVKDQDGRPLAGVLVELTKNEVSDTTGTDGKYLLAGVGVSSKFQNRNVAQPIISRNAISFLVSGAASYVGLEILDLSGRCVKNVMNTTASAQPFNVQLPLNGLAPSTYIVALRIGKESYSQRVLLQENGMLQSGKNSISTTLDKRTASGGSTTAIDEINFYKSKFAQVTKSIFSYTGTFDTIMSVDDTIPPKITVLGGDTVSISFQDSSSTTGWRKFWNPDSSDDLVKYEDNSGWCQPAPATSSLIDRERSSFVSILYNAVDLVFNQGYATRLMVLYDSTVDDVIPPVLIVTPDTIKFSRGEIFDPYTGVTAVDSVDKHIELKKWIRIADNIKSYQTRNGNQIYMDSLGTYSVKYEVMDTHKNMATRTRTLIVSEAPVTP